MLPIKSWRIFYADGSTFDSTMGTWAEAPPFGVQCVVYYHDPRPYKTLHTEGNDASLYYFWGEGDSENFKMGLWMDEEGLHRILDLARKSSEP
jgi:hypothetical protein